VSMTAGSTLHWLSDGSVVTSGFTICATHAPPLPPTPPPTPPLPPSPPSNPPPPPSAPPPFSHCETTLTGNGVCDFPCVLTSLFTDGDCTSLRPTPTDPECSPGCAASSLGNTVCEPACDTISCVFDWGDCACSSGCTFTMLADGNCDPACANNRCNFDYGDCSPPQVLFEVSGGLGIASSIFTLYGTRAFPRPARVSPLILCMACVRVWRFHSLRSLPPSDSLSLSLSLPACSHTGVDVASATTAGGGRRLQSSVSSASGMLPISPSEMVLEAGLAQCPPSHSANLSLLSAH
jgi:hypothetical protein